MRVLICCFFALVLFSSVNSGSVVKQISPKDFPESSRKVQARIVNGDQAVSNQFPYQVAIRSISDRTVSICGGSILSNEYILTAAHCTKGYKSFEIGFGSNVLQSPLFRVVSQSKIEHPGFDSRTLTHDISVIKLPGKIPFNLSISPILLPKKSQFRSTYLDENVTVSGYGRESDKSNHVSQNLNFIHLRVISASDCANIFGSRIVTKNVICAKGIVQNHHNTGACMGDSGGPLTAVDDGVVTQIGVVSFVSSRGCAYGDPSGYTNVGKYLDWISNLTGIALEA